MQNTSVYLGWASNIKFHTYEDGGEVCNLLLATRRPYKSRGSKKYKSDFIPCRIYGKSISIIKNYVEVGDVVGLIGPMQSETLKITDSSGEEVKHILLYCKVEKITLVNQKTKDDDATDNEQKKKKSKGSRTDASPKITKGKAKEMNKKKDDVDDDEVEDDLPF